MSKLYRIEETPLRLRIVWTEQGGPPVQPPERAGFGRLLLERALAAELHGEVQLDFATGGVRCTLTLPLDERPAGVETGTVAA